MAPNDFRDSGLNDFCKDLQSISWQAIMNICLFLLLFASSLFKIRRITRDGTSNSLAFSYLFLGVIFNIAQIGIGLILCMVALPGLSCLKFAASLGFGVFAPALLLLMSATVFINAMAMYRFKCTGARCDSEYSNRSIIEVQCTRPNRNMAIVDEIPKQTLFNCLIGLDIIVFLLPYIFVQIVTRTPDNWPAVVFIIPHLYFDLFTLPFLTFGQFIPELRFLWQNRNLIEEIRLDCPAMIIDAFLYSFIGVSWRLFIASQDPHLLNIGIGLAHPFSFSWEIVAALMWLDYVVLGFGQGLVLCFYLWLKQKRSNTLAIGGSTDPDEGEDVSPGSANETMPLLALPSHAVVRNSILPVFNDPAQEQQ